MDAREKIINTLNELLEKNYDAERGYRSAAQSIKNPRLGNFLLQNADIRKSFAIDLTEEILEFDGKPSAETSTLGDLHRAWINFKSAVTTDSNEEGVLEECIRGEEEALKDYNQALKTERLDDSTVVMLEDHRSQIALAISELESLEGAEEIL